MLEPDQNSQEQMKHKRENQKRSAENIREQTDEIIDKRLDGPNRPST